MLAVDKGTKVFSLGRKWIHRHVGGAHSSSSIRGTVRSADNRKYIIEYFTSLGYGDKINVVIVEDIAKVTQ